MIHGQVSSLRPLMRSQETLALVHAAARSAWRKKANSRLLLRLQNHMIRSSLAIFS